MTEVTADMTITLDGYAAGEGQSRERPFGDLDPERLHGWMFTHAGENAEEIEAINSAGSYVMGRKMFASEEGEWDLDWHGHWVPILPSTRRRSSSATGRGRASR
jgi:dihydrofolate reductase